MRGTFALSRPAKNRPPRTESFGRDYCIASSAQRQVPAGERLPFKAPGRVVKEQHHQPGAFFLATVLGELVFSPVSIIIKAGAKAEYCANPLGQKK